MKKYIILFLFFSPIAVYACDICGSGVGTNYIGILPDFHKHIMGLRLRQNGLRTHISPGGGTSYLTTDERYKTIDYWMGLKLSHKITAIFTLPYSFNSKSNSSGTFSKNGLGDISTQAYYSLLNKAKFNNGRKQVQSLLIGAGLKIPTGQYAIPSDNTTQDLNLFQSGTGSIDFTTGFMYNLQGHNKGLNVNMQYKWNTHNKYNYKYGNKISSSIQFFLKKMLGEKIALMPNAGFQYEQSAKDIDTGHDVYFSGGSIILGTLGCEVILNRLTVGANWQAPCKQFIAQDMARAKSRAMLHMALSINKKR